MKKITYLTLLVFLILSCDQIKKNKISDEFRDYKYEEPFKDVNFDSIENNLLKTYNDDEGQYIIELRNLKTEYDSILIAYQKIRKIEMQKEAEQRQLAKQKAKDSLEKVHQRILSPLRSNYDELNDITWYKNTYFTHYTNSNRISIYMGRSEYTKPYLRIKISYTGDDWIFFDRITLLYGENERYEIPFNKYENKKTDNDHAGVWEWIDIPATEIMDMHLEGMANSSTAKIIFSGKYRHTHVLRNSEKKAIKQVLEPFYKLTLY